MKHPPNQRNENVMMIFGNLGTLHAGRAICEDLNYLIYGL